MNYSKNIKNINELANFHTDLNLFETSINALERALESVDPENLINNTFSLNKSSNILHIEDTKKNKIDIKLESFKNIHIFGAGKATARMTKALVSVIGNKKLGQSAINIPYNEKIIPKNVSITEAAHPIPDINSIKGTKIIIEGLKKVQSGSLVFILISGGASSLLCSPKNGLSLKNKQEINKLLLKSGASIHEINIVRKHLSEVKGGQLLKYIINNYKSIQSTVIYSLILSDVVGDDLNIIGSAPTVGDNSKYEDAIKILKKYKIWNLENSFLEKVKKILIDGKNGILEDLPKKSSPVFNNVHNILIGNNELACNAASFVLMQNNFRVNYIGSHFELEAVDLGKKLFELVVKNNMKDKRKPIAYVLGGESVVKMEIGNDKNKHGKNIESMKIGKGGRNQEAVLNSLKLLKNYYDKEKILENEFCILSCGTDGIDGNSNSAGGIITSKTVEYLQSHPEIKIEKYLREHNSNSVLKILNSLIITGRTGTNVNDISIVCCK